VKYGNPAKQGFTVTELLLAVLATAIMALAVGSVLVYIWKGWIRHAASVEMQRDATLAMRIISREVRRTDIDNIAAGATLTCVNTNGTFVFAASGRNLTLKQDNGTAWPLVRGGLSSFQTSKNADESVTVRMDLGIVGDSSTIEMNVFTRN